MSEYGNYHCFGFNPERTNKREIEKDPDRTPWGDKITRNKEAKSEILFDVQDKPKERVVGYLTPGFLNLTDIKDPEPTIKMFLVLRNLYDYGFITLQEHNKGTSSFFEASKLIDEHQGNMHKLVNSMNREEHDEILEDMAFELGFIWGN